MPKFCVNCGAPLSTGPFCVNCGADMRNSAEPPQPQAQHAVAQTPPQATPPPSSAPAKQGMSPLVKLGIATVAIIFVGGIAGAVSVYYVVHRVSQRVHQAEDRLLGSGSDSGNDKSSSGDSHSGRTPSGASSSDNSMGDVCRFLSKEDVSRAIGVAIIRTHYENNGCTYFATGTQTDMMAKHATAMAASRGADKQSQENLQKFAGTIFNALQSEAPSAEQDSSGEVPVFSFSLDQESAEQQMRLNEKVLGTLGSQNELPGIADHAFVTADGIIMMRKGKTLARIVYLSCPCGTEAVRPLAKRLADRL